MWSADEDDDEIPVQVNHRIPATEAGEHTTNAPHCWCHPYREIDTLAKAIVVTFVHRCEADWLLAQAEIIRREHSGA